MRNTVRIGMVGSALAGVILSAGGVVRAGQQAPAAFTLRSKANGAWSRPATWDAGRVPGAGDRVLVSRGTRVTYDADQAAVIRYVQVAGVLSFARDRDTTLNVGLITIQASNDYSETGFDCHAPSPNGMDDGGAPAALEVGTAEEPIPAPHAARIRLHLLPGMDPKTMPAIVCCGGRMDFHGAPMSRTWVDLGRHARPGDREVILSEPVTGWRSGDEVLLTGAKRSTLNSRQRRDQPDAAGSESRRIARIEGATVQLDRPLEREHFGEGEFRSEIANLSRTVVVESADPAAGRGHTMYHRHSSGSIGYARFAHLGKEGQLGRYPIHFHLAGDTMRGSSVIGAAIVDSHNRWITVHGTHYLLVRDCIGYRSLGHGFFLEDGTETYNLLDRNLGVQAYRGKRLPQQVLPFDPNDGAAFWWANGRNSLTRNVSCENEEYGYRYDMQRSGSFSPELPILMPDGSSRPVDVRTLPLYRFDGNEAHTEGLYGAVIAANGDQQPDAPIQTAAELQRIRSVDWTGPDTRHPHIVNDLRIWEAHYGFRPHSPSMLIRNLRIHGVAYGVYRPAFENQVFENVHLSQAGPEPFNRGMDDASAQNGSITVDGLRIDDFQGGDQRHPVIHMTDNNLTGRAANHFRSVTFPGGPSRRPVFNRGGSVRVDPFVPAGVPYIVHDYFGPGRHARIVSTRAADLLKDGQYRSLPPLTGDESVAAEVTGISWPKLLEPIDDLPPATVVLTARPSRDRLHVSGVAHDNGVLKSVRVNGAEATLRLAQPGVADWEIEIPRPADGKVRAWGTDAAGNTELQPHEVKRAR